MEPIKELEIEGGRIEYRREGEGILILSCKVHSGRVVVPEKIENLPVTGLGKKAFLSAKPLKEVRLPEALREIGDWAFAYCSLLESVWLPRENLALGRGIFKECQRLAGIYLPDGDRVRQRQVGRLLGAVPVKLETDYLFSLREAGEGAWLARFDQRLSEFLAQPDEEGYTKMVYCGEEDIVANMDYYLARRRREKAELCFLRLINSLGLSREFEGTLSAYLCTHTKGCPSEAAWECVFQDHGNDREYYEAFTRAGCLMAGNYDGILLEMGEQYPEMKAYLMRYKSRNMEGTDFFASLSLD